MSELDVFGALAGTDKSSSVSWGWDYLRHYEALFDPWRDRDINVIEIGVAGGSSLAAWRRYFGRAQLVGIDVNPECRRFEQDRVAIRIGSQDDPGFLQQVAAAFPPTIVIDDGSHIAHHMITTFETLFPSLLPGGCYVFEDMAFHFEDKDGQLRDSREQQGFAETSIFEYLNRFTRARAAHLRAPQRSWGFARYAHEHIDSITIMGGMIAIRKTAPRNVDSAIEVFEREIRLGMFGAGVARLRFAAYLMKHDVDLKRAADILTELTQTEPTNVEAFTTLLGLLSRLGRFDEAADVAAILTKLNPGDLTHWERRAEIERHRQRFDLESMALRHLIEARPHLAGYHHRLSISQERLGDIDSAANAARRASEFEPANQEYGARRTILEARRQA